MYSNEIKSLQSKCLNVIFLNFDNFRVAFLRKPEYKIYLPIFQKCYGDQILKKFNHAKKIKSVYLRILCHKYLTELNFQFFEDSLYTEDIKRHIRRIGHVINSVSFYGKSFSEDVWKYFPNVCSMDLSFSSLCNKDLRALTSCPHLKDLNFSNCRFLRDSGLKYLVDSKLALEKLNVTFTAVTVEGVAQVLNGIPSLRNLIFENVPCVIDKALELKTSSFIATESKVFNLENLSYPHSASAITRGLTVSLTKYQKACPFINNLAVSIWKQEDLVPCSSFLELGEIFICTPFNIDSFLVLRGENIHTIKLKFASLSLETLLNNCPKLEVLSLSRVNLKNDSSCNVISKHLSLKSLEFYHCSFNYVEKNYAFYSLITLCPALKSLKFYECAQIDYIASAILIQSKCLKVLLFYKTPVNYFLISAICESCQGLELYLHTAKISQQQCNELREMVSKRKLGVSIFWQEKKKKRSRRKKDQKSAERFFNLLL